MEEPENKATLLLLARCTLGSKVESFSSFLPELVCVSVRDAGVPLKRLGERETQTGLLSFTRVNTILLSTTRAVRKRREGEEEEKVEMEGW